jgi:hypothetical protein
MCGAASLGVFAIEAELQVDTRSPGVFGFISFAAMAVQAFIFYLVIRAAVRTAGLGPGLFIYFFAIVSGVLSLFWIAVSNSDHPPPSLFPKLASIFAILLTPILFISFAPVLMLARDVRRGETERGTRDVAAAGDSWAAVVSALGTVLAPGGVFAFLSGMGLVVAAVRLKNSYDHELNEVDDRAIARSQARALLLRGLRTGGLWIGLIGLVMVPVRFYERTTTWNPAVIAIYRQGIAGHCDVRRAGREGNISLWLVDCGSNTGPLVGWDEQTETLLRDEALYARVPRVRAQPAAPPSGAPTPR